MEKHTNCFYKKIYLTVEVLSRDDGHKMTAKP
jgi:hypothetical protein